MLVIEDYIVNNTVYNNKGHGIMIDRNVTNSIIKDNIVQNNDAGIMLFASSNNTIINNSNGIRISDFSYNNYIEGNYIKSASRGIYSR